MAEEIAFENGQIFNFEGLVTLTLDRSYCIPSCIAHRPLRKCQISLKSKKLFVDKWTYVCTHARTYVHTDGRMDRQTDRQTFKTGSKETVQAIVCEGNLGGKSSNNRNSNNNSNNNDDDDENNDNNNDIIAIIIITMNKVNAYYSMNGQ